MTASIYRLFDRSVLALVAILPVAAAIFVTPTF